MSNCFVRAVLATFVMIVATVFSIFIGLPLLIVSNSCKLLTVFSDVVFVQVEITRRWLWRKVMKPFFDTVDTLMNDPWKR